MTKLSVAGQDAGASNHGPWICFHCGDTFTDRRCARQHFGRTEDSTPACIIKGADGGLLRALRDAEEQADDAIQAMHAESTDAARAYHAQRCRHSQALIAAEEAGYERGLYDSGRAALLHAGPDAVELLERYAEFIRTDVKADDLERHPYLPELERVHDALRDAIDRTKGELPDPATLARSAGQ